MICLTWVLHFLFKVHIKNELPLLAGDYVLGYYSTNMQTLIAFSPTFQVSFHKPTHTDICVNVMLYLFTHLLCVWVQILESKRAVKVPENINGHEK